MSSSIVATLLSFQTSSKMRRESSWASDMWLASLCVVDFLKNISLHIRASAATSGYMRGTEFQSTGAGTPGIRRSVPRDRFQHTPSLGIKMRRHQGEDHMAQKVIDIVGISKESFAKAAENAVAEAAKTVRGVKWAPVAELEMELEGAKIMQYRATTKIYFDVE